MARTINSKQSRFVDELVNYYTENIDVLKDVQGALKNNIESSKKLGALMHSVKSRLKDPEHLRDKLNRKIEEAKSKGKQFSINKENLFSKINDLVGFRIIHLHTRQFKEINSELNKIFKDWSWILKEGPTARTWDDEYREYFTSMGIAVTKSPSMYTSVHYVVKPNLRANVTCEIQVRTLMEELWGEVDHQMNYPHKTGSVSCQDQIKVLARITSSSSRLVDSIFFTQEEFESRSLTNNKASGRVRK